jgi:murein peptide amidase A
MTELEIQQVIAPKESGLRNLPKLVEPLLTLESIQSTPLGPVPFRSAGEELPVWRFTLCGPNSSDPIRIGIFGSIHGDEPAGALAAVSLLRRLAAGPDLADNFLLQVYPVCNPTGFVQSTRNSARGRDLNREFWKSSDEPEIRILEKELKANHFHGIVQLHADDTSEGVYGFVRGHTLTENLLRPALREAGKILPRNVNATIDGFAARDGIIFDQYEGILAAPPEVTPVPFEIVLETPHLAPVSLQIQALETAVVTILSEYRRLISFAANI